MQSCRLLGWIGLLMCVLFAARPARAAAPDAATAPATSITPTSAALNGFGTPNGEATTGWFRLSPTNPGTCDDTFGTRVPTTSGTDLGTGATAIAYSISATGLTPATTYYYCAIVQNASGTAFGSIQSFSVPGTPTVTTDPVSSLQPTSATLNASATPNGASTSGWFRYDTADPGTCDDSFGTRAPSSGGSSLGSGFSPLSYTRSLSGLTPATTYYYCAIASNTHGTSFGAVVSFTTPAAAPTASTSSATLVTGTTAQLNGSTNPGGASTTAWFRYSTTSPGTCNDTFGTRAPATGGTDAGSGNGTVSYSESVTGLSPGTTYYYCAIAQNSVTTTLGNLRTFTTPAPPTAVTAAATSISSTSATLNGSGIPNLATTTGYFRYSATDPGTCNDTFGSRAPTTGGTGLGAGSTSVNFSRSATGLSAGTTYYFCAITENAEGMAFGAVLSFTTLEAPIVTTEPETNVTATSASFNGTANPNGASTTGWFRYDTTDPGICSDSFGSRWPSSGGNSLGSGTSPVAYTRSITSLLPNTTYYYCAIASNSFGTSVGTVESFTTPPDAPTVSTSSATSITGTTAQLNGSTNPRGATTTAWFRYDTTSPGSCNDTFGTRAPATGGTDAGSGNGNVSFSEAITGLTQGTTYYYCAIAESSVDKVFGTLRSFTTPSPPTAVTSAATSISSTSATLNGSGIPNLAATTGYFRYAATDPGTCNDTFGSRLPTTGGTNLGTGSTSVNFSRSAGGLSSGTTYYFCAITENAEGKAFGSVMSFTTLEAPIVTTEPETDVTATSASFNGTANPNGASTTGWFRYDTTDPGICSDAFGSRWPSFGGNSLGSGTSPVAYTRSITSLLPNTTYYYCAIASNTFGTAVGTVESFTTPPDAPTVSTSSATSITGTTAQLNGSTNPRGATTTAWFRYSTTSPGSCNDTFGTRAPTTGGTDAGSGNLGVTFSEAITGLTQGTTYYFCAIAENSVAKVLGSLRSFTTPAPPTAVTSPATSVSSTSATLNGSGIPNLAATTGYFRYSATDPGTCNDTFGSRLPTTSGTSLGAGSTSVNFSRSAGGLSTGTTYYFCAITENAEGKAFGSVMSFTTLEAPIVTTEPETNVTATSASFNGTANPNGASTTGWFRYDTTDPGICSDAFGTRWPSSGGNSLGAGTSAVAYTRSITSLLPNTTYYYCAIASNSFGTAVGTVESFTTPPDAPTVSTSSATSITGTTAQLNGSTNPRGATTTAWFRYSTTSPGSCNDTFGTRAPATGGTDAGSGNASVAFSEAITGLSQSTTYYYCAIAENSVAKVLGSLRSFTTPAPPTAVTTAATSISSTSATLNGSGIPNLAATTGYFRYSATDPGTCNDTFGSRLPTTSGTSLGAGSTSVNFSRSAGGLSTGTTYYFCAITENAEGKALGSVMSFTTLEAPIVTTEPETNVTATSASFNGTANPNGASTTGWFRYDTTDPGICSDAFGFRWPSFGGNSLGSGTSAVAYTRSITSLFPNTTYYYCAIASNTFGTAVGTVESFTTPPDTPAVSTSSATSITGTTAQLNGSTNPRGATTTAWFRYDTTSPGACNDTFGTRAPATGGTDAGSGNGNVSFSETISGLSQATTYYYCAIAESSVDKVFGTIRSFTTPAPPTAVTTAATSVTATSATLNGSGVPNLSATTGYFRYSATDPGTCNDTFGSRLPTSGGTSLGTSSTSVPFSRSVSGLSPGVTYYFCAITENAEGMAFGEVLSFLTLTEPVVTTEPETNLTPRSVSLNGTANPNGASTTGWFRYATTDPGFCSDSFGTRWPSFGGNSIGSGTDPVDYTRSLTNLTPNTTYYYCAVASNTYGTALGTVRSFTTPPDAPTASTSAASNLTTTSAQLNGSSNPGGATTTAWFRYSTVSPGTCNDTFGIRAPSTGGTPVGSGTSTVSFSLLVAGLTPDTTYYYCAITENSEGKALGNIRTFTTPTPPTVATLAATPITTVSTTLNGVANPNGFATTAWFRYSLTNPGACNDTFGTRAPTTGGSNLGSGTSVVNFSQVVPGLAAATTYYFCAIAESAYGTTFGEVLSFTTPASLPAVTTVAASDVTPTTAVLNATAIPGGADTTGWFRYSTTSPGACNDSFGTRTPAAGGTNLGNGNTQVPFTASVSGLTSGVTYYFCAIAANGQGTSLGAVLSFTPSALVSVTTQPATAVSSTAATLNGSANPNGTAGTGWFRYATTNPGTCNDTFGTRTPATGGTSLGSGTSGVPYSQALTGLSPATTYYYCAIAANGVGTGFGTVLTVTTPAVPQVTTAAATSVEGTTATFNGSANPLGATTSGWFRFSSVDPGACNDTFGTRVPATGGTPLGSGTTAVAFSNAVTGLSAGTTYYYCAIADNSVGTGFGSVQTFTTQAFPGVTTLAASGVSDVSATLNGSAAPNLTDAVGWFRYDTTDPGTCNDTFGTATSSGTPLGAGASAVPYSEVVSGLTPATTYYYCALAANAVGTAFGAVQSFTTTSPPVAPTVVTDPATSVSGTAATLEATANPNGWSTTGWFRYDTSDPGTCNDTFGTRSPSSGGAALGSGSTAVGYTQSLTGLSAGTTYYYCAIADNAGGTAFGQVESFTTPTGPTVTTQTATSVTPTSATLNASSNPNGDSTVGWFRYDTTDPGACDDTFGTRVPSTGGTDLGSGTAAQAFSENLTALTTDTTYYYCAIAQSAVGTVFGSVESFTTGAVPSVVTDLATTVTSTTASLEGTANPEGSQGTGWFRYDTTDPGACDDAFGTRAPATGGTDLGSGTTDVAFSEALTGLSEGTTYYYCAIADNAGGTAFGSVQSFTTLAAPTATTLPATSVTSSSAVLEGTSLTGLDTTTGWFRYDTTDPGTCDDAFGTRAPATGGTDLGAGAAAAPFAEAITGLASGTTYYFCAITDNSVGTSFGAVLSLTTSTVVLPPTVTSEAATSVTAGDATLEATALPNGTTTTVWFRYDTTDPGTCDDAFGTRLPVASGTTVGAAEVAPVAVSEPLTGLTADTTYYYCAIAENAGGFAFGEVLSLTTATGTTAPTVTTQPATGVGGDEATFNGSVNANGEVTSAWFRYDTIDPGACDDAFGTRVPAAGGFFIGSGTTDVAYSDGVTGLPATTIYYCAIAENVHGVSIGTIESFSLVIPPPTVTTDPPLDVTATTATLAGAANPNGDAALGWFRLGDTDPGTCDDAFGARIPAASDFDLGAGNADVGFEEPVVDLEPDTTYYYCAAAQNGGGAVFGNVVALVTPPAPAPPDGGGGGTMDDAGASTDGGARLGDAGPPPVGDAGPPPPPPPPPPLDDAGTAGADGALPPATPTDAGADVPVVSSSADEGGCGCRTHRSQDGPAVPVGLAALGALLALARRRQRSGQDPGVRSK